MNTFSADMLELLGVVRALNAPASSSSFSADPMVRMLFAADEDGPGHWITLHNKESGEGTTHVKIGEGGNIEAGPKSLEGQNVEHLQKHPLFDRRTGQVFQKKGGNKKSTGTLSTAQQQRLTAEISRIQSPLRHKLPDAKAEEIARMNLGLPGASAGSNRTPAVVQQKSENSTGTKDDLARVHQQAVERVRQRHAATQAPTGPTPQQTNLNHERPFDPRAAEARVDRSMTKKGPKPKSASIYGKMSQALKKIEPQQAAPPDDAEDGPASEPSIPVPSGMKTDLFGKSFIDSAGVGEQKPLFHQPVDYQKPDTAEFKKFKEQDTPGMFPAKGEGTPREPSNVEPARQPDKNDRREVERDNRGSAEAVGSTAGTGTNGDGAGNGPTEPPDRPVASGTPDEPDRGDESPVPPGGAERGNPSAGTEGAEPAEPVEQPVDSQPPQQSEQDIAQAVNRGEMSVDDVLKTHPHLAGDALIEQHKRERDEEQARAQAEQEAEEAEHAMGSESDLPEGELPDFGPDLEGDTLPGDEPVSAPVAAEPEAAQPADEEPDLQGAASGRENPAGDGATTPPDQGSAGASELTSTGQRNGSGMKKQAPSRGAIEKMLLDNLSQVGGGYTAQDEHELNEAAGAGNPFTFHKEIPAEVKEFIAGHPEAAGLRKLFRVTNNPAEAGGADAFGQLGDRYLDIAEAKAGTPLRQALQEAKNSPDPQVRLLAAIYELPKGETKGKPQSIAAQKLETGAKFTIKGVPVEVVKDEDGHRSLKDGGEIPDVPIDALTEPLPVDKGSLKPGKPTWAEQKPEEEKPAEAPVAAPEPQKEPETPESVPAAESAPVKPQSQPSQAPPSPRELQADVQNGLAVLGINPRQAEVLARTAIQLGHATVVDAIKWALANPNAKPQATAAPATPPASPTTTAPAAAGTPPATPSTPAAARATAQTVRQRAKTTPPPSKLPPLEREDAPTKTRQSTQSISALAAAKPARIGGPKQKQPAAHMPSLGHGKPAHVPATPPASRFIKSEAHIDTKLRSGDHRLPTGIHEQPGERGTHAVHHGRAISEYEQRKAKGRTLEEMGHFSADDGSAELSRMLSLLELVK